MQRDREEKAQATAALIATILLQSRIIPPSGLIPPYRVAASALRTGRSSKESGANYSWEPFELSEPDYWSTVVYLEKILPEELMTYPHLRAKQLRLDTTTPPAPNIETWVKSLRNRGL